MSQLPPQTLSVKRKRGEAPVDALRFDHTNTIKRQKSSQNFAYRRLTKPDDALFTQSEPVTPTAERRFHLTPVGVGSKRVFVEARPTPERSTITQHTQQHLDPEPPVSLPLPAKTPPRKRPGAGSALRNAQPSQPKTSSSTTTSTEPSEADVRKLEAFSAEVSRVDNLSIPPPTSPSKHKPRVPAKRYAERHPEKAFAAAAPPHAGDTDDAMDIDNPDDYVIDTYIREPLAPDAPLPTTGTIGLLVLSASDDDWWDGDSGSDDREFDTDDEDENAEDYYANDYPEDELSEDDEFGRDVYQRRYRRGSSDEGG